MLTCSFAVCLAMSRLIRFSPVRKGGLEPPRASPRDPKSRASTSSATFARKYRRKANRRQKGVQPTRRCMEARESALWYPYVGDIGTLVRVLEEQGNDLSGAGRTKEATCLCRRFHGRAVDADDPVADADALAVGRARRCDVRDDDAAGARVAELAGKLCVQVGDLETQHRLARSTRLARRRSRHHGSAHQLHRDLALLTIPDDAEPHALTGRVAGHESLELPHAQRRLAVDLHDHVAALQPRAPRR